MQELALPVILAMLVGKLMKSHEGITNKFIPILLLALQFLQELASQLQGGGSLDLISAQAAAVNALPVVAGAVLAHQSGKGVVESLKRLKLVPVLKALAGFLIRSKVGA